MRSERQALADIGKLCDKQDGWGLLVLPEDVRAILADVQTEPAPVQPVEGITS